MKRKITYTSLLIFCSALLALIFRYRTPEQIVPLKLRNGELSLSTEWAGTQQAIDNMLLVLADHPEDQKTRLKLAYAYIQESRITGDHAYYDSATLQLLDDLLNKEPNNAEALCAKATVLLSQHHFTEAIAPGEKARELNPYLVSAYGVLTDANLELGNYQKAIRYADTMVSIRPDIRSYSRISYLREIHGDINGAIDAMKMAVEAGYPGLEQTEWCRVQLGHLYESSGDLFQAQNCYKNSVYNRPTFAFAYAGLGRIEKAKNNYYAAQKYFEQAIQLVPDASFYHELTDLFRISNRQDAAARCAEKELECLAGSGGDESAKVHGHYADKELALVYLDLYDYSRALQHALIEYNRRPENIEVNQTLAWVYFKMRNYVEANRYINKALATNCIQPVLMYQAGLIKKRTGENIEGEKLIRASLTMNPFLSPSLLWEDKILLANK